MPLISACTNCPTAIGLELVFVFFSLSILATTERIFVPGKAEPLPIPQDTPESLLLQRIRDEAHRFAIRYHRELRKKTVLRTGLEGIPGVGKKRQRALLDKFGTLRDLRQAAEEDIAKVVGKKVARSVYEKLCSEKDPRNRGA